MTNDDVPGTSVVAVVRVSQEIWGDPRGSRGGGEKKRRSYVAVEMSIDMYVSYHSVRFLSSKDVLSLYMCIISFVHTAQSELW